MKEHYLARLMAFLCAFFLKSIYNDELLSPTNIKNMMRNSYIMDDSKNFSNFSFFYLYNALRCTLTQKVFESYEDERYQREIVLIKKNLLHIKKQRNNRNLWIFFEYNLPDSLIESIEEVEANMRNYGIGLMEIFNELKISNPRFDRIADMALNICSDPIFAVEEVSLYLTTVPFLLDKIDHSPKEYLNEFEYMFRKTLNFFNFVMSLINEHSVNIIDIYKKEINLFLKVKDQFNFLTSNEENILSLYDEIYLKNKYGNMLTKSLFILLRTVFFFETDYELHYFNYIELMPIYVRTSKGMIKSKNYDMENSYYSLIENTYKNELQINEGILMIRIIKQYNINNDTKIPYYFDSDIIYKSIMYEVHKPVFLSSYTTFQFLHSQNVDGTYKKSIHEDITLSLIILISTNLSIENVLEKIQSFVFSKDIFLINKELNEERIKVMGSCTYTKESQPPIFQGFFSRGLSTYILLKLLDFLKPNTQLLYLSIEKAEDNNQIRSEIIAERILNNPQGLYKAVLLFERDAIIKYDKFKYNDECDMCLVGYKGLYTLYLCIFLPIITSLLICYYIYMRKKKAKINMMDINSSVLQNDRKSIEPVILPLKL
ncbi:conserved Plasmodium protein, unknown function [Plasmodium ovale]|uniref:PIR protein n=1 Tax=Plasmodium ovale TaxID=36330 RepID=A0A1C3KPX5_PLAOA|nr:conserved Plasmodium protein, unknown function [Plasmodium ovale]